MMNESDEVLNGILQSADRHPNSRVSKLIRTVESERTQKNIVMLLIELAESAEYATDFGISLKYYLDLFERLNLGRDIALNETGLLLLNSSKIYSRRVDFVHELIERQILTLSNADREIADAINTSESSATPAEKPKRGRKRLLEAPKDPYEVTLALKKFRKISHEKRFAVNSTNAAAAKANQVKLKSQMRHTETEQNIHPAGWVHSSIVDLENDEEIDSKRNYKLFTYHVEHRYNTLVPDINFRLHFMVKDFIDEEEEQLEEEFKESGHYPMERATTWPPLSEAYVEQYLQLENRLLEQPDRKKANRQSNPQAPTNNSPEHRAHKNAVILNSTANEKNIECSDATPASEEIEQNLAECNELHFGDEAAADETTEITQNDEAAAVETTEITLNDSALGESICEDNDTSVIEQVKDENKNSNISSELVSKEFNTLLYSEMSIHDKNKDEKAADCDTELEKLESAQNNNKNEENRNLSSSLFLDTSTNIKDAALNSTSINSSAISSNESSICLATTNLSTSIICANQSVNSSTLNSSTNATITTDMSSKVANESGLQYDSALGSSILDSNYLSLTQELESSDATLIAETQNAASDLDGSALKEGNESLLLHKYSLENYADHTNDEVDENKSESCIDLPSKKADLHDDTQINLDEIRIHLPHLDDEGVFFSDLDEQDQRMLSPTVMALDVFPSLPNKNNFTIIVDDDIRAMLNILEDEPETYVMPQEKRSNSPVSITLNIMQLPEKTLRRRVLFKLGSEYDLFLKARMRKRKCADESPRECRAPKQMKWFPLNDTDMSGVHVSPSNSPGHSSSEFNGFSDGDESSTAEFLGFPEDDQTSHDEDDKNHHRLSRDSGVDGVEGPTTMDKTSLNTIAEEVLKETEQIIEENHQKYENITEAIFVSTNDDGNTKSAEENISKVIEINNASNEIITPTEDPEEQIKPLSQEVGKDAVNGESITNTANIVDKSTADLGNVSLSLDTTNDIIFSVDEITQGQNLDDLLNDNDDNQVAADADDDDDEDDLEQAIGNKETCVSSLIEKELANSMDDIELNSSKTKIQKWHEHLQPILSKSRERHHFDVFQIGTEIMNELEHDKELSHAEDLPKRISFEDVMESKDPSYVSRYFLSSLLLANQSNIKITVANKNSEEPTAWKDIQFDLLSTKRHTVSIEDNIGMVKKVGVAKSNVTKLKTAIPKLKRAAATTTTSNSSTKYNHNVDAAISFSSSSCYSTQALQQEAITCQLVNVNLDIVKPLKHIEKLPRNCDDYDSGIFSSEELM